MYDVICVGDTAIDDVYQVNHLPGPDQKVHARYIGRHLGGTTCNTALALNSLGDGVMFVTLVGEDNEAIFVQRHFDRLGIAYRLVQPASVRTPATLILLAEAGEKAILLLFDYNQMDEIQSAFQQIPSYEGIVAFCNLSLPVSDYLSRMKCPIVVSLEEPTLRKFPQALDWAGEHAHTLIMDRHAYQWVFHKDVTSDNLLHSVVDQWSRVEHFIVTLGSHGSLAFCRSEQSLVETQPFSIRPVDTTGAGDIFNAAYIHAYFVKKQPMVYALRFANAVAAASCEEVGTTLSARAIKRSQRLLELKEVVNRGER